MKPPLMNWRSAGNRFSMNSTRLVSIYVSDYPGEDLHDGVSFEMFLDRVGGHKRCNILYDPSHFVLQQLDYLEYIDIYHDRIKCFM